MAEAIAKAQKLLDVRGYVVAVFFPGPRPIPQAGEIWDQTLNAPFSREVIPGPFLCIGHTTKEEYLSQLEITGIPSHGMARVLEHCERAIGFVKLVAE